MRITEVVETVGVARSTIYEWMSIEAFPRAVRIGKRAMGWHASDIADWLESRPEARAD